MARRTADAAIREHLARLLDWEDARVGFDAAVAGVPAHMRGTVPPGLPHSIWQLVEHIRLAQHDILDFSRNAKYEEMKWPDDYWPASPEPPDDKAWDKSVAAFRRDRRAVQKMAADPTVNLNKRIPHGTGQTYLREVLLVLDHNAYHVGELVMLRRLLGAWKP